MHFLKTIEGDFVASEIVTIWPKFRNGGEGSALTLLYLFKCKLLTEIKIAIYEISR